MTRFRHEDCPFECEIPNSFGHITHGVTYYGYSLTATDLKSGNDAEMVVSCSPTHEQAVDLGVEAFLDALSRGEHRPEKLPVALGLRPKEVPAFEQPLVLWGGVECFHVAREICTPTGLNIHDFYGRAFFGEGRIDFKFSASTSVDDMQETWRNVMLSVRVKEER